jgi:flagellin-like protein
MFNKKGVHPVVATALLLVVAVVGFNLFKVMFFLMLI